MKRLKSWLAYQQMMADIAGLRLWVHLVLLPVWSARDLLYRLVCWVSGHDWEDEGHAGPDSGYIHLECQRCGYSSRCTILY